MRSGPRFRAFLHEPACKRSERAWIGSTEARDNAGSETGPLGGDHRRSLRWPLAKLRQRRSAASGKEGKPCESLCCCPEELAALVEHGLFDHLAGPQEHR